MLFSLHTAWMIGNIHLLVLPVRCSLIGSSYTGDFEHWADVQTTWHEETSFTALVFFNWKQLLEMLSRVLSSWGNIVMPFHLHSHAFSPCAQHTWRCEDRKWWDLIGCDAHSWWTCCSWCRFSHTMLFFNRKWLQKCCRPLDLSCVGPSYCSAFFVTFLYLKQSTNLTLHPPIILQAVHWPSLPSVYWVLFNLMDLLVHIVRLRLLSSLGALQLEGSTGAHCWIEASTVAWFLLYFYWCWIEARPLTITGFFCYHILDLFTRCWLGSTVGSVFLLNTQWLGLGFTCCWKYQVLGTHKD